MLTKEQVTHFKSFGFVILRQFFSPEEMRVINDEFEYRSKVASSHKNFDGSERHNIRMMGSDTPFFHLCWKILGSQWLRNRCLVV
ncbi:MAG: hypothetical protein QGE99_05920 [SAR202 cluster bacterium]|jgi:hypothetical protein|nr:hypothetical protein [SAR202 cluster bacterium]